VKIIFLDVDGVLNNFGLIARYGFDYIDDGCVSLLSQVVKTTGAEIVLSSSWRLEESNLSLVRAALGRSGLKIKDCTPFLRMARIQEIKQWIKDHPEVTKFVILDDDEDAGFGLDGFFQTDPEVGFTSKIAEKIVLYLGEER
jgi:hypothetical protein